MGVVHNSSGNNMDAAGDVSESSRYYRRPEMTETAPKVSPPIQFVPSSLGFRLPSQIYSDDEDHKRKRSPSVWIKSKSRRFWIIAGLSLLLIVIIAVVLPLYFVTRSHDRSSGAQNYRMDSISRSVLVDIMSSDDEATRARVLYILDEFDDSIDKKFLQI